MRKALAALVMGLAATGAFAQAWPTKPVTMIVPFPPGGSTDMIARAVQPKLVEATKGTFIIDNKPGAGGAIGAVAAKNAKPDGYTIFVSSLGPFVIGPHLLNNSGYDPTKDFDYITVAVQAPNILAVRADSPHKSFADVVKFLKANPDKMTFASAGNGTSDHLTAELFWQQTGTTGLHVPYKGGAPAIQDLIAGHANVSFQNINAVITQIQSGKLKALAITSSKRSPLLPDVPTLAEAGVNNAEVYSWQAIAAPKGLPADVKKALHEAIVKSLRDPATAKKMTDLGFEIVADTPEEFARFQQQELARWKKVIETAKIEAN